jgi:PadR family transcriptional regulator PadR
VCALVRSSAASCGDLAGTLDLLILKTLDMMGPMHGYRIARRSEQVAENLAIEQGSIYPARTRLEEQGWIRTQWGVSETKRKVEFYSLTSRAGAKQLNVEVANWERATALGEPVPRGGVMTLDSGWAVCWRCSASRISTGSWRVKSSPTWRWPSTMLLPVALALACVLMTLIGILAPGSRRAGRPWWTYDGASRRRLIGAVPGRQVLKCIE